MQPIKKPKNWLKNSFSLFEVILSISILSLVISGFLSSNSDDKNTSHLFMLLNKCENDFSIKNYTNMIKTRQNISLFIDGEEKDLEVDKYIFQNKDIKIFKYETK